MSSIRLGHGVALVVPRQVLRRRGIPRTVIADIALRLDKYISGHVQYRQMPEFDFPALVITVLDIPATPVALGAGHGAADMDVDLAVACDFHMVNFDPFYIKRNCDILGHGTPRFKITLLDLATICLYWACFLPFKFPESQKYPRSRWTNMVHVGGQISGHIVAQKARL